jgi:hypothetical protein
MKVLFLILLILIQGITYASDDKPEIGRYQLVYGVTQVVLKTGELRDEKGVWKIDTVTGQVWQYLEAPIGPKGEYRFFFTPIETRD